MAPTILYWTNRQVLFSEHLNVHIMLHRIPARLEHSAWRCGAEARYRLVRSRYCCLHHNSHDKKNAGDLMTIADIVGTRYSTSTFSLFGKEAEDMSPYLLTYSRNLSGDFFSNEIVAQTAFDTNSIKEIFHHVELSFFRNIQEDCDVTHFLRQNFSKRICGVCGTSLVLKCMLKCQHIYRSAREGHYYSLKHSTSICGVL